MKTYEPINKILIIDDENIVGDVLKNFFSILGYESNQVYNGVAGLECAQKECYSTIFTDLRLPGMNGVEITRAIRSLIPDVPVVIMTGHGDDEAFHEAMDAGASGFLKKPFSFNEIKKILDRVDN